MTYGGPVWLCDSSRVCSRHRVCCRDGSPEGRPVRHPLCQDVHVLHGGSWPCHLGLQLQAEQTPHLPHTQPCPSLTHSRALRIRGTSKATASLAFAVSNTHRGPSIAVWLLMSCGCLYPPPAQPNPLFLKVQLQRESPKPCPPGPMSHTPHSGKVLESLYLPDRSPLT